MGQATEVIRDPLRITAVLRIVEELWRKYPDLRLGQLIVGLAGGDPFYLEDDDLLKAVKQWQT